MAKRIAILNGGGDCAGLNAVIAAIVKTGSKQGYEFLGIIQGFEGLLAEPRYLKLGLEDVKDIVVRGGTILKSTNKGRFAAKVGSGDEQKIPAEVIAEAKANIEKLGIEALIVIGGDGTLTAAMQLAEAGVNIVGVPKTIDNDLCATERTFGFSTAIEVINEALDRIRTTAASHNRVMIIETMGRNAGWLALYGGIAGDADVIIIPEIAYDAKKVVAALREQQTREAEEYSIIVIAEGAKDLSGNIAKQKLEQNKEHLLGGVADKLMREIEDLAPDEFEIRTIRLGHLQRGGSPNAEDRLLAQRYGVAAMELIIREKYGYMPALQSDRIVPISLQMACGQIKSVTIDSEVVRTARSIGISFGD